MRHAHPLLLSSVLLAACDDESVPAPRSDPAPLSWLSVCEGQPELGDTWQLERGAMDIQLDAEGNVYLIGSDLPECANEEKYEYMTERVTKIGARGDVRWVRTWRQDYTPEVAVAPSGQSMVLGGNGGAFLVDGDGEVVDQRKNGTIAWALAASSTDFLLASIHHGGPIRFDRTTFEPANEGGIFVITLDGDMRPRTVLQPAPDDTAPIEVAGVVGLSDGDVVTVHTDETEPDSTVLMRFGAHPWRALVPLQSQSVRLFVLQDDSVVVQVGTTVSRFASGGMPIWSRDYGGSLRIEPSGSSGRGRAVAMHAAASLDRIVIAFGISPSEGPFDTSAGPVLPDGVDIGFATINVETGLFDHVTLERAPNDQSISGPVLARDGAIVARLASTWDEPSPSGGSRSGVGYIVRRRLAH